MLIDRVKDMFTQAENKLDMESDAENRYLHLLEKTYKDSCTNQISNSKGVGSWRSILSRLYDFKDKLNHCDSAVYYVDWIDSIKFCNWLSDENNFEKVYNNDKPDISKNGFRLPSESEWYYASTCGGKSKKITSYNTIVYRNNRGPLGNTKSNNRLSSNKWGICGMLGNINEWKYWDILLPHGIWTNVKESYPVGPDPNEPKPNPFGYWDTYLFWKSGECNPCLTEEEIDYYAEQLSVKTNIAINQFSISNEIIDKVDIKKEDLLVPFTDISVSSQVDGTLETPNGFSVNKHFLNIKIIREK